MVPPGADDDQIAMAELAAGQDSAMNGIMRRWQERLTGFLLRMVGNHATASDLAQETFVRLYRHRSSYHPQRSFSTWIFTIAANLARNHHRWSQRRPEAVTDPVEMAEGSPSDGGADPLQRVEAREKLEAVQRAIAGLPQDQKETLILAVYEQLSHDEIAAIADSTPKAVELRLYRARKTLRESLASHLSA